jgi:hypothetical protein
MNTADARSGVRRKEKTRKDAREIDQVQPVK